MSLILTNLKLGFEPHVLNLFSKFFAKDPKKEVIPSNYHEFWSEEVHNKKHPKKRKLRYLNIIIS
jgi:hypothetical protein